jgi:hypothetical protein
MARHRNKHKPFGDQSRRHRKLTYINIKNQIRRAQPVLGGLFYSQDHIHGKNGWIDCYFLGKEPLTFYNCTLETARCAYVEAVSEAAWEEAEKLLPYHSNLIDNAYVDSESGLWRVLFGAILPSANTFQLCPNKSIRYRRRQFVYDSIVPSSCTVCSNLDEHSEDRVYRWMAGRFTNRQCLEFRLPSHIFAHSP